MRRRQIRENVEWLGAVDWDRRLFDSLIPLPDGTSYNAYLVKGSEKTALLDTVDPKKTDILMEQLKDVSSIDYLIAHHAEQDHSGSIPAVLEKYPEAKVICTPKCKGMLIDHLGVGEEKFITVNDCENISLGDLTFKFIHAPWVHWPETMLTYLPERKILFTCDFFGSHLATTDLYATDEPRVYEAAKRYFAEIMMPFRVAIKKNLEKIKDIDFNVICPSHGPVYGRPEFITDAYHDWVETEPRNSVVLPYISMHGSTALMVERMVSTLASLGVSVHQFDLAVTDIGKLAEALVDAATVVMATPTVHQQPHPAVVYAAHLANAIRPKVKFVAVIGSYGWSTKALETLVSLIPSLKVEVLGSVLCRGLPREADFAAIDELSEKIAAKHKEAGLMPENEVEFKIKSNIAQGGKKDVLLSV